MPGKKIEKSIADIEKLGQLTPALERAVVSCTSAVTLDQVHYIRYRISLSHLEELACWGLNMTIAVGIVFDHLPDRLPLPINLVKRKAELKQPKS